jgi:predicted nucleic acid-binding protein
VSYLLDTNVVSEIRKPQANPYVRAWFAAVPGERLYLSVLTVGEIRRGIERLRRRDPTQAAVFEAWLASLRQQYADRLLPVTAEIAEEWGRLNVPDPIPTVDGLLAATARVGGLVLVTRNTADLARTGVRLLDPFTPTASAS